MICPKCGEKFNYYEPCCPWCRAPKPVEEWNPAGDVSPSEEKEDGSDVIDPSQSTGFSIFVLVFYVGTLFLGLFGLTFLIYVLAVIFLCD
jgi:hypothetical protein